MYDYQRPGTVQPNNAVKMLPAGNEMAVPTAGMPWWNGLVETVRAFATPYLVGAANAIGAAAVGLARMQTGHDPYNTVQPLMKWDL